MSPLRAQPRWLTWIGFLGGVPALVGTGAAWHSVVSDVAAS